MLDTIWVVAVICTSCYWLLQATVIDLLKYYICNSYKTPCFRKKKVIQIDAYKKTSCARKSEASAAKKTRTETAPGTSKAQELVKQNKYSNCGRRASLEVCMHCKVLFYIREMLL